MKAWVFLVLLASAGPVLSEGAVQRLDCVVVTRCIGAGACAADAGTVTFTLDPTGLDPHGRQRMTLAHDGVLAAAVRDGPLGPIRWQEGEGDLQTLLPTGPDGLLWHRLSPEPEITATTLFLTCESPG